jgi:hypothetical protein
MIYDVNGDTTAATGAVCANSSDDILLGVAVTTAMDDGTIGTAITDCDSLAAATTTLFKTLTHNGDADYAIVYDVSNDDLEGIDTAAYTNTAEDIRIIGGATDNTFGSLPTDCDAAAPVALNLNTLALLIDAGSADSITYSASSDTVAANGTTCTAPGVLAGGTALPADCEVVTFRAGPSVNFTWSDNSSTSHATSTSDWNTGYLVDKLSSDVLTLSK